MNHNRLLIRANSLPEWPDKSDQSLWGIRYTKVGPRSKVEVSDDPTHVTLKQEKHYCAHIDNLDGVYGLNVLLLPNKTLLKRNVKEEYSVHFNHLFCDCNTVPSSSLFLSNIYLKYIDTFMKTLLLPTKYSMSVIC